MRSAPPTTTRPTYPEKPPHFARREFRRNTDPPRHAHMRSTSQDSAYGRFRRARARGNVTEAL
jgi:hypothetical protein